MLEHLRNMCADQNTKLAFWLAFIPICSIVGFLPYHVIVYYAFLLFTLFYGILISATLLSSHDTTVFLRFS